MASNNAATVTAKTGPNVTNTAIAFQNVTAINYDLARQVLTFTTNGLLKEYDLNGVTAVTTTITGGVYAITIA